MQSGVQGRPPTVPQRMALDVELDLNRAGMVSEGAGIGELRSLTGRRRLADMCPEHSLELLSVEKRNMAPRSHCAQFRGVMAHHQG